MKAGIDVYMSMGTWESIEVGLKQHYRVKFLGSKCEEFIGDFTILPFDVQHDAKEPLGFLIKYGPTKEKLLFITDSYYCKYKFSGLHAIMIECNYIKETLDYNIEQGYIQEGMKRRLLESHFSLENVKKFLKANDLSQCREIILLHLSDSNSSAQRMVKEIEELTGIKPKIADPGLEIDLEIYPY